MQNETKTIKYINPDGSEVEVHPPTIRRAIDDQRYARGYTMFLEHRVTKNQVTGDHFVLSSDNITIYKVENSGCSCKDFERGFYCKHAIAVDFFEANQ